MELKFKAYVIRTHKILKVSGIDLRNNKVYFENNEILNLNEVRLIQYVGLKDKNQNEIYEGDIIAINNEKSSIKLPVKFGKYSFGKYIGECGEISDSNDIYGFYVENEYLYIKFLQQNVIVLGNIYEK